MKPLFYGIVNEEGKLTLDDQISVRKYLMHFKESAVQVSIEKKKRPRSNEQNGFLWCKDGPYQLIGDFCGYTKEEAHEAMRIMFLSDVGEHGLVIVRSTTDLSTEEFSEYLEQMQRWAAIDLDLYLPNPGEVGYQFQKEEQ